MELLLKLILAAFMLYGLPCIIILIANYFIKDNSLLDVAFIPFGNLVFICAVIVVSPIMIYDYIKNNYKLTWRKE